MKKWLLGTATCLGLAVASASGAQAAFLVQTGIVGGSGDVDNVLFNSCTGNNVGPALTISGCLNGQPTTLVNLTSDENILGSAAGGQALVTAADGIGYSLLEISLAAVGDTFAKLQLNINASADGQVTFSGVPGSPPTFTFNVSANGNNQFTITGENFSSVKVESTVDIFADIRQIRLGGIGTPPPPPIPAPAAIAVFGVALAGLGLALRRRQDA